MKKILTSAVCALSIAAVATSVFAATPEEVQSHRKGLMQAIKTEFLAVKAAVDAGTAPSETAAAAAMNLAVLAAITPKAYAEETKSVASNARPEVWSRMDEFKTISARFSEASTKLAAAAKGSDAAALKAQFGAVAGECKACHDAFRAD